MTDDPYLWLEEVTGETALDWVRERNATTVATPAAMQKIPKMVQRRLRLRLRYA